MATICLVSYEIHPTTKGGCGVLLHHAAEVLLERGATVIFLLDLPRHEFEQFRDRDRLALPHADRCRAYLVDDFLADFPVPVADLTDLAQLRALRFAHAVERLCTREPIDLVEFFDFCGVGFYALSRRLFADDPRGPVLGVRLHSTLELLDRHGASSEVGRGRYQLWGFEHGALRLAEAVLTPTQTFYEHYYRGPYRLPPEQVVVAQSPKRPFPRVTRRPEKDGEFRIVFFGRMFHLKGVDQFVHAALGLLKERPALRCRFDLIGYDSQESPFGGSYTAYLRQMIPPALRDRFDFAGHQTHEQVAARLNAALFAVFPNRLESFCYALHEVYDAGVPVIVNDLPAFADFFHHERNALVYDGTMQGLLAAMKRLLDDEALRARLCRPYPVAEEPLGTFYESPRALTPIVPVSETQPAPEVLVIVLCPEGLAAARPTLAALAAQTAAHTAACLVAVPPASDECAWLLGQPWRVCTPQGESRGVMDVLTRDAVVLLRAGDLPEAGWLQAAVTALRRRADLGFAGTWVRRDGRLDALLLDVVPELWPFDRGPQLTRAVVRTQRGVPLLDLFDANLGSMGEIGLLWDAVARWGPGRLRPAALLDAVPEPTAPLDAHLLQYLLASHGAPFTERLALLAGIIKGQQIAAGRGTGDPVAALSGEAERLRWQLAEMSTSNYKLRAAEDLGGRDLLKIVVRKVLRRVGLAGRRS